AEAAGWRLVLGSAMLPALLALVAWLRHAGSQQRHSESPVLPWRRSRAWALMAYFGIGTCAYTLVLAWLPVYYMDLGLSASRGGLMLGDVSAMEVVAWLLMSIQVARFPERPPLLRLGLWIILVGVVGLSTWFFALMLPAILLVGLGIGVLFPLQP